MTQSNDDTTALSLAAPALLQDEELSPDFLTEEQSNLDDMCERWVGWCRSRRLYGPPPSFVSILGQLSGSRTRPMRPGGPDAAVSAELAAFHIAYTCQPDALDKRVFDLYYVHRVKPIKAAAEALGISRKHYYVVLSEFRSRVFMASRSILSDNEAALAALPHSVKS